MMAVMAWVVVVIRMMNRTAELSNEFMQSRS